MHSAKSAISSSFWRTLSIWHENCAGNCHVSGDNPVCVVASSPAAGISYNYNARYITFLVSHITEYLQYFQACNLSPEL